MPLPMNSNGGIRTPQARSNGFADDAPFMAPDEPQQYADDGDDGDDGDLPGNKKQASQSSKLEALLTGQVQQIAENRVMTQLLSDPNLRAVIEAQRAGKKIKVIPLNDDGSDEGDGNDPDSRSSQAASPPVDLDSMSPAELTQHIIKEARKQAPKSKEDPKIQALQQQVQALTSHIQQENAKKVDAEVKAVMERYPDFDNHKPAMLQLSQENPGLKVQELYALAKMRAGESVSEPLDVATERPVSSAARPSNLRRPKGPIIGNPAFNNRLHDILANKEFVQASDY
jgi:hypothetical protein